MLEELITYAIESGATAATIVSARDILIDSSLADRCREPRCENYGLAKSCPPHVSGPLAMKKQLEYFNQAIFFKIDVPSEILYSSESREIFQLLHEIGSGIERSAVKMGFVAAQAYAGGSCKEIFCHEHHECLALSEQAKCRNPHHARPSMSGFGVDVAKLFATAGWTMKGMSHATDSTETSMASVCGLVLIS